MNAPIMVNLTLVLAAFPRWRIFAAPGCRYAVHDGVEHLAGRSPRRRTIRNSVLTGRLVQRLTLREPREPKKVWRRGRLLQSVEREPS